jgi:hypothetical protein
MRQKLLILVWVLFVLAAGCKKNKFVSYTNTGTLTGFDLALCPCCGGVFLEDSNNGKMYRIESLPGLSGQDFSNLAFPRKIKYNFQPDRECGGINYIQITGYKFD